MNLKLGTSYLKMVLDDLDGYMAQFGARLPERMRKQVAAYKQRLSA